MKFPILSPSPRQNHKQKTKLEKLAKWIKYHASSFPLSKYETCKKKKDTEEKQFIRITETEYKNET